jgi:hypothetical protein
MELGKVVGASGQELARFLQAPFPEEAIEWRIQQSGVKNGAIWARILAYVTNRAIQDRMDLVFGPDGWRNEYSAGPGGGILCGLSGYFGPDRGWVTKWDGAANTEVQTDGKLDTDTNVKGGLSASMKRAATQWGIGRYLYDLEAAFATVGPDEKNYARAFDKDSKKDIPFRWSPPRLPAWALPGAVKTEGKAPPEPHKVASESTQAPPAEKAPARAQPDAGKTPWAFTDKELALVETRAKEIGASSGTVRMAFVFATDGAVTAAGDIDRARVSEAQFNRVLNAMASKEALNDLLNAPPKKPAAGAAGSEEEY